MKVSNSFDVSLPPSEAWTVLMDVESIVSCVPGAELIEKTDDQTYKGKVAIALGPVALTFMGNVAFQEVDADLHRARLRAQGQDDKGRGGANATVVFQVGSADGGSRVDIETNLMLSGAVAQYGRAQGVISQVADEVVRQFSECLTERLAGSAANGQRATTSKPLSILQLVARVLRKAVSRLLG